MNLEERVRAELLAVRKTSDGLTVTALTSCPTTCVLLGGGDAALAYNRLKTRLLDWESPLALRAAMASLALTSGADTHLGRLSDFGEEHGYDQRQVRRYSDRGIRQMANLIATRWADAGTPNMNLSVFQPDESTFEIHLVARRPAVVEMRDVALRVRQGDDEAEVVPPLKTEEAAGFVVTHTDEPITVELAADGTSVTVVWNGELWPKYAVGFAPPFNRDVVVETLGAKLMIRV